MLHSNWVKDTTEEGPHGCCEQAAFLLWDGAIFWPDHMKMLESSLQMLLGDLEATSTFQCRRYRCGVQVATGWHLSHEYRARFTHCLSKTSNDIALSEVCYMNVVCIIQINFSFLLTVIHNIGFSHCLYKNTL